MLNISWRCKLYLTIILYLFYKLILLIDKMNLLLKLILLDVTQQVYINITNMHGWILRFKQLAKLIIENN